jgi:hypothetical protein
MSAAADIKSSILPKIEHNIASSMNDESDGYFKKASDGGGDYLLAALLDFEGPLALLLCFLPTPDLLRVALVAADSSVRARLQSWPELWALSLADQPELLAQVSIRRSLCACARVRA